MFFILFNNQKEERERQTNRRERKRERKMKRVKERERGRESIYTRLLIVQKKKTILITQ